MGFQDFIAVALALNEDAMSLLVLLTIVLMFIVATALQNFFLLLAWWIGRRGRVQYMKAFGPQPSISCF